jgi:hypothetical protein
MNAFYPKSILFFVFSLCADFLFAQPVINHFAPTSGPVGTSVTITGSNFDPSATNNIVYFGAVKANVTGASATALTVVVPTGLSAQSISVTTNGLTGFSSIPFALTFYGGGVLDTNFIKRTDIPISYNPQNLISIDIDGDGKPDMLAWENSIVAIHLNMSSGDSLSLPLTNGLPGGIFTVGDIDGDGKPDIIILSLGNLKIERNTSSAGSVSFDPPESFPVSSTADGVAVGDIDGDGKLDILSTDDNGAVTIFRNTSSTGNLSIAAGISYDTHEGQVSMNLADMDGDGKPDIVLPASSYGLISIFRNLSSPGNIAMDTMISYQSTSNLSDGPISVATGDLDGDGKNDFAVTNFNGSSVSVFRNTGHPGFLAFASPAIYPCGSNPRSIVIGDLDGDGRPDIAVANESQNEIPDNSITLYKNTSGGAILSFASRVDILVVPGPVSLSLSDLDGNGEYDLAVGSVSNPVISVLRYQVNPNGPPKIISFTPSIASAGDSIMINGVNFTNASTVSFGGTPAASYQVISSTKIKATVNAGTSGNVEVIAPNGIDSLKGFVFYAPPTIAGVTPDSGSTGTPIMITGKNLYSTTSVSFGGTQAQSFTVLSDSVLQAVVAGGASGNVSVTTEIGSTFISGFHYFIRSSPVISSFSPAFGSPGSAIIINGLHFTGTQAVYFGNVPAASMTVLNDSMLSAIVGGGESGNVKVITPAGTDSLGGFRFIPPGGVRIYSFTPNSGWEGVMVTIHGIHFTNTTAVSFGGTPANYFNIDSDSLMEAWIGFGSTGALMVTTYGSSSDSLEGFTYTTRPPDGQSFSLDQLTATPSGSSVNIQWQTENDQSISRYVLASAPDSISMQPLAQISSSQIPGVNNYSYVDLQPKYSTNYYQLQAIDTLGNISYTGIVTAKKPVTNSNSVKVFPNPATNYVLVDHPSGTASSEIKIMDMMGKILFRVPVTPGTSETKITFSSAWKGFYKVVWTDGTNTLSQSLIINE